MESLVHKIIAVHVVEPVKRRVHELLVHTWGVDIEMIRG